MHAPLLIFLLVALAPLLVDCGGHASIKSKYGQLVTSSTLRWRTLSRDQVRSSQEAVPSGTGNPDRKVCRAEHHGSVLTGHTIHGGSCAVAFVNKIYKKHKYETLFNIDLASKLEWRPYTRFAVVPEGAVAGADSSSDFHTFLGRHLDVASGKYLPGAINVMQATYSFGPMTVFSEDGTGAVKEVSSGDVLVEVEPTRYKLEIQEKSASTSNRGNKPKVTRQDVVLAKSSLFRFDEGKDREARLQKVLSYDYVKSEYYGQIPGMLRALPSSIQLSNGQTQSILWGLPDKSKQTETLMVGMSLAHFRAVDVSVVGVQVSEEHAYSGILTTYFPDGGRRERRVEGVLQRTYLNNIRPEYSRVYKIKDSVVVEATPGEGDDTVTSLATPQFKRTTPPARKKKQKEWMMSDDHHEKAAVLSSSAVMAPTGGGAGRAAATPSLLATVAAVWAAATTFLLAQRQM